MKMLACKTQMPPENNLKKICFPCIDTFYSQVGEGSRITASAFFSEIRNGE